MARRKNAIGLDIGSSNIKLVLLKESGKGIELTHFAMAQLPPEAIVDGDLISTNTIVQTLQAIIQGAKISSHDVAVSVSGHAVIIKMLTVPMASPEEIAETIRYDAEQQIPFDSKNIYLDHQVMRTRATQEQVDVLLAVAKKDRCDALLDVVREAGLNPVVLDVDCFAIQNAFEANYGLPSNETIALLNIGASTSNLSVIDNGIGMFARDIIVGGNLYTQELQKQLGISYAEAEHYKQSSTRGVDSEISIPLEAERIISMVSETIANEINRSFDFYRNSFSTSAISRIYLSGGTAKIPSLSRIIERRTGIAVEMLDPFRNIKIDSKVFDLDYIEQVRPMVAVAVGLALRRGGDK